ncbi:short chain dehydrogenase [Gordonia neofelifaecis NRRL B-59395]|uniref:Short chain dehydrogenase n=1 Tax=Gordonia neofelifaecis NRRL B-59395 TaxID=644548 RepID=F1YL65_9ACTN|nr:short chain dehydrogenase [Gordonia neofelifaecis NRRL B-59395]
MPQANSRSEPSLTDCGRKSRDTDMQRDIVAFEGGEYDPSKYLRAETVAAAVAAAVTAPADSHPTEIVLRPRASRRV